MTPPTPVFPPCPLPTPPPLPKPASLVCRFLPWSPLSSLLPSLHSHVNCPVSPLHSSMYLCICVVYLCIHGSMCVCVCVSVCVSVSVLCVCNLTWTTSTAHEPETCQQQRTKKKLKSTKKTISPGPQAQQPEIPSMQAGWRQAYSWAPSEESYWGTPARTRESRA